MTLARIYQIISNKYLLFLDLILMFVLLFNPSKFLSVQHYQLRILLYLSILPYLAFNLYFSRFTKIQLGLTPIINRNGIKFSLISVIFLAVVFTITRTLFPELFNFNNTPSSIIDVLIRIFYYAVISAPIQELIFRSYLITRLEQFTTNKYLLILISSLIFSIVHWPFGSFILSAGSFVLGIFLADNFLRYRSLGLVTLMHFMIGVLLVPFTL